MAGNEKCLKHTSSPRTHKTGNDECIRVRSPWGILLQFCPDLRAISLPVRVGVHSRRWEERVHWAAAVSGMVFARGCDGMHAQGVVHIVYSQCMLP